VCPEILVDERFARLLRRQLADGFSDLRGAEAAVTIPVTEKLLNEILAESLPHSAAIRDLHVTPLAGDRFTVRARLGSSALLPPFKLTLAIDRQPDLPASPVLILRLVATGLMALARPVLRLLNAMPEGIRVKDDRIHVDLRALAERYRLDTYFDHLDEIRVNSVEGSLVLAIRGRIR
jgi:hypothetical protein